jgi:UDP:flavonoid glycosyltransferase YjiC (YdhE family)
MKCLIIPSPDTTSLNIIIRCLSIATEAQGQGHEVAVMAPQKLVQRFSHLGLKTFSYPEVPFLSNVQYESAPIKRFGDYAALIGLNDEAFVNASLDAEADAIRSFGPDVVYSDISLTAPVSAKLSDTPLASLCNLSWLPPFLLDRAIAGDERQTASFNRVMARHGFDQVRDLSELIFLRSDLKIVPSCPEFEQYPPDVTGVEYVGHLYSERVESRGPPGAEAQTYETAIIVYMGVGDIDMPEMARELPAAFDGGPHRVVVVAGDFCPDLPGPTANVRYERFLPLTKALSAAPLVIFHGGSGLVMTCLLYGVPGLMFPCGVYEREFHAETMAKVGAGIVLYRKEDFEAASLRGHVQLILEGQYRQNARTFGRYLRGLGGPRRAVELLHGLATGTRVPPASSAPPPAGADLVRV